MNGMVNGFGISEFTTKTASFASTYTHLGIVLGLSLNLMEGDVLDRTDRLEDDCRLSSNQRSYYQNDIVRAIFQARSIASLIRSCIPWVDTGYVWQHQTWVHARVTRRS